MSLFQPVRQIFACSGLDLVHPIDRQPQGKYPYLSNVRSQQDTTLTSRPGYGPPLNASPFSELNIHSIRRLNNLLPGAVVPFRRFVGAGTKLFSVDAGLIDSGYSGNPLSLVAWRPDQSTESYLYVGDSLKMSKVRLDAAQTHYNVGITPPTLAPTVILDEPHYKEIDDFLTGGYANAGTAGAATSVRRDVAGTVIGVYAPDADPPNIGWVNIVPENATADYGWIGQGTLLTFNQGGTKFTSPFFTDAEEVVVQEVHLQVANSFIQGIQYDSGNTGRATIQAQQPLAGLDKNSAMQVNVWGGVTTSGTDVTWAYGGLFDASWVGFVITINFVPYTVATVTSPTTLTLTASAGTTGAVPAYFFFEEVAIVDSFTVGPDGLYSFTCNLQFPHAAGDSLIGRPSFRCFVQNVHVGREPITATAIQSTVATGTGTLTKVISLDLSQPSGVLGGGGTAGRPLTPEDFLHISIRVDRPDLVVQGLIELDVDATVNDFSRNYYFTNFQPNLQQALLTGGATALATLESAATATLINQVVAPAGGPGFAGAAASANTVPEFLQLYGGANAWTEIQIPLIELTRVGADTTRSIANVQALRLSLQTTGAVVFQASSWWVGGGYGPNTGLPTAQTLKWRYRYRSSLTGAKSQQSPGIRTGIPCYRQQVLVTPTPSGDPQVDQVDIERFGGVLNEWHFVGTLPNDGSTFEDTYSDDEIKTAPSLETDQVMPFPSFDVPRRGTCDVVGTNVAWRSGDHFDTRWAPGQEILIAGIPYIVYGQPTNSTSLQTVENVGVLAGAPFIVAEPTLIGQPMPHIIGPFGQGNFLLSFGDPRNPGTIRATKGNDPDAAPIEYYLELSDPSEPIVGGVIWDNNAIVASNKRWWRIDIDANAISQGNGNVLIKQELNVGRGLFSPWAICAGPLIWFLDEAGVPCVTNGSKAESIVENDLRPLFPHDGAGGVAVNGFQPPDFSQTPKLRLSYANGQVYFMYLDTGPGGGTQRCLVYNPASQGWFPNDYAAPPNLAYFEEAESVDSVLLGGSDGNVYGIGGFSDNGADISCQVKTGYNDLGNSRSEKFWGDAMFDCDPQGVDVAISPVWNLGAVVATAIPILGGSRAQYQIVLQENNGQLARNGGLEIAWSSGSAAPVLYEWQPSAYDTGVSLRKSWVSLPTAMGMNGWAHLRDGYLPLFVPQASTVNLTVIIDGIVQGVYPFTPSTDLLQKMRVDFLPRKGLMYQFKLQSDSGFLIFSKDVEVYGKSWGSTGPYVNLRAFGDPEFTG